MRDYVLKHPNYNHDSIINENMNFDILKKIVDVYNNINIQISLEKESGIKISPEYLRTDIPLFIHKPMLIKYKQDDKRENVIND